MGLRLAGACVVAFALGAGAARAETAFNLLVGDVAFLPEAQAIATSINHEKGLRVMPVLGEGSVQAARDLRDFPQIDAALITTDALTYAKAQNLLPDGKTGLSYISVVKPLPVILVARSGLNNITALAGKKIATGPADSAAFAAGELLLGGLEVPFLRVPLSQDKAVEALGAGKADAALFVGPPQNLKALPPGFHAVALALPSGLARDYQPLTLSAKDYPALVAANASVDTLSTRLVLAVNPAANHPALKAFAQEFFRQTADTPEFLHDEVAGWPREANAASLLKDSSNPSNTKATIQPAGAQP